MNNRKQISTLFTFMHTFEGKLPISLQRNIAIDNTEFYLKLGIII